MEPETRREPPAAVGRALAAFKRALKARFGDRLETMRLFGSWARGEAHDESDIDVLVVVRDLARGERRAIYELAYDIYCEHDLDVSPLAVSRAEWNDRIARELRLARDIEREGISL